MNWFYLLVMVGTIVGAAVLIPRAIRHDQNLAALEALDDEALASEAAAQWEAGRW